MHATYRQIDRLVLVHKMNLIVAGDLGRSLDDDPMLGEMEMLLQGQALARLHDEAFDVVALPEIDRLIVAPWPPMFQDNAHRVLQHFDRLFELDSLTRLQSAGELQNHLPFKASF